MMTLQEYKRTIDSRIRMLKGSVKHFLSEGNQPAIRKADMAAAELGSLTMVRMELEEIRQ